MPRRMARAPLLVRRLLAGLAGALLLACNADTIAAPEKPLLIIAPDGGDVQTGVVGSVLPKPIVVQVTGVRFPNGQLLNFVVTEGDGSVFAPVVVSWTPNSGPWTGELGIAQNTWTLGLRAGPQSVEARLVDPLTGATLTQATFHATATAGPAAVLTVATGDQQTAVAGAGVPTPPAVRVTDEGGNPVGGIAVTFTVTGGGGSITGPAVVNTGMDGIAAVEGWTLGTTAGQNTLQAASAQFAAPPVTFTATGHTGSAAQLVLVSGNNQTANLGSVLPQPPTVRVIDQHGNGVPNFAVTFTVVSGAGSLDGVGALTTLTDPTGAAKVTWTLGPAAGPNTLQATAVGLQGSPIMFTATAGQPLAAPSNLTTTAAPGSGTQLDLSWQDNTTNEDGFRIERCTGAGCTSFAEIATVGPNVTSYQSTGLTPGTSYSYRVRAYNAVGTSDYSNTATMTTPALAPVGGRVIDGSTGIAIEGATVRFLSASAGVEVLRVPTDGDGRFQASLPQGVYDIEAQAEGYVTVTLFDAQVSAQGAILETIPLVPTSPLSGAISGSIRDARTGFTIPGAAVELRPGMNAVSGMPTATTTSDATGQYRFEALSANAYTVVARASAYSSGFRTGIVVGGQEVAGQDVALSPSGASTELRIVLTWGAEPRDLDSHLTGPTETGDRFHVYYSSRGSLTGPPWAALDIDETSRGPETITIVEQLTGAYRYSVHDYTNRHATSSLELANSGARVDLYRGGSLIQSFFPPGTDGTLWTVFELEGEQIRPVNRMSYESDPGAVNAFAARGDDGAVIGRAVVAHPKNE